ncbi:maestro heat-like repeat-containing protein family member 2B [Gopherus evgoodei]|uniref:maestro heat-like repeat-containing protein family member 2B n=1 Tax=Gopherus evgoodei TaxID=1825980 RepID=UPI0011CEF20A|nr:maestro heat-like repeat-containing protein family member 2B [Gopherus evgoodei]
MLLQFLRTTLEMIDDSAWSRQISLELSQQMASYTSPSHEKSFLYKALGTSLAVCQDLVHVKSQLCKFLTTTDYMEVPERQRVISILAFSAESHLDLTLNALHEFGAAMSKVKISGFISRLKVKEPGGSLKLPLPLKQGQQLWGSVSSGQLALSPSVCVLHDACS